MSNQHISDDPKTPDGLPPLRDVIRRHGLQAQKSLGQNFIFDFNITRRIARAAGPLNEITVVEVGPGPGGLTRALLFEGADSVICIERDERCLPALNEIASHYDDRLTIQQDDALAVNWRDVVTSKPSQTVVAANLPYNIATKLLVGWLETDPWPPWYAQMILMFQKEVVQRIVAQPHSKTYGRLSVLAQWRSQPTLIMNLPPEAFTPPPRVASAVVKFIPNPTPSPDCSVQTLSNVTACAFGQRRKMLRQSLKGLTENTLSLLGAANIAPDRRAETLSVKEFARLARTYEKLAQR